MGFRLSGDLAGDLVSDSLMYYREDGTAEYTGLQRFTGQIAGRSGTCVMVADGGYDGGEARSTWRVIPGSGSGDLAGLAGSGVSVAASRAARRHLPPRLRAWLTRRAGDWTRPRTCSAPCHW